MRRREFCLGLVAMPALARSAFAQEVSTITLIKQHGLPYLPMMLMEEFKLVEKHAARLGVANLKTDYRTLGGTQSIIDALIGGSDAFRHHGRARPCDAVGQDRRHAERSARALRRAGDAVHPRHQPARDQDRSRTSRKATRSRCRA